MLVATLVALGTLTGCTETERSEFKSDADQAGDAAKNTYEDAKDATKQGINKAANDVAEKTR